MTDLEEQMSDTGHDFFGPGTDLAISLVAVLMLVVATQVTVHDSKAIDLEDKIQELQAEKKKEVDLNLLIGRQHDLMNRLATELEGKLIEEGQDVYRIPVDPASCLRAGESCSVTFRHQLAKQRIMLGESVLFAEDRYEVDTRGREVLGIIARVLKERMKSIQEVHIEGHADNQRSNRFESNLELAARRAMAVFNVLEEAELSPLDTIVSVASLGEFVPVDRQPEVADFSKKDLEQANDTDEELRINRRVEISLIYRWPVGPEEPQGAES